MEGVQKELKIRLRVESMCAGPLQVACPPSALARARV